MPRALPGVTWWSRVSSVLAPVLLIGGWALAASLQPGGFDPRVATISDLAALDATDRWVMTVGIAGTGVCHLVTASGLRSAALRGRVLLGIGGAASLLVAVFPLPAGGGTSSAHRAAAFVAFLLLTVWAPYAGSLTRRRPGVCAAGSPWRPVVSSQCSRSGSS